MAKGERRHRLRIPLNSEIELRPERGLGVQTGQVRNLTSDGILFETLHAMAPGQIFEFVIPPAYPKAEAARPIRGRLRVQRAEGSEPPFQVAGVILDVDMS